jgi:hypothetical protein
MKFVPHSLMDEQKTCKNSPHFLSSIITGDKFLWLQYNPETKHQSME